MKKRILAVACCLLVCLSALMSGVTTVFAASTGNLTVEFEVREAPVSGVAFRLYHVASHVRGTEFQWTDEYAGYSLELALDDESGLARTLSSYIKRDSRPATAHGVTGADGKILFAGLDAGVYVVIGDVYTSGRTDFTPVPALIFLPYRGSEGQYAFDADIAVKHTVYTHSDPGTPTPKPPVTENIKATKIWDEDDPETRPSSVRVQLLRDGSVYAEATLNAGNRWRHIWTDLSTEYDWTVVEAEVPEGYTLYIDRDENNFQLYNLGDTGIDKPDVPEIDTPDIPDDDDPPADDTDIPPGDVPKDDLDIPPRDPPKEDPPDKLVQTGMNWWKVFVPAGAGVILVLIGAIIRRRGWQYED